MTSKRVYIRAVVVPERSDDIVFEIPMWKPGVWFTMSKWNVPSYERGHLHPGFRCNVTINALAETKEELQISDWSLD